MLKIKILFNIFNFNDISDRELYEMAINNISTCKYLCSKCHQKSIYRSYGSYSRTMITIQNGVRKEFLISVPRKKCVCCGMIHSCIPDMLIPFGSYSVRFVVYILYAFYKRKTTVDLFCDFWRISVSTLYEWKNLLEKGDICNIIAKSTRFSFQSILALSYRMEEWNSMNKNLFDRTKEWMELERKTLEQRKLAEEFYDLNLMHLIMKDYIKRNKKLVFEKVKFLVISVGMSYEPIVLNLSLFEPEKVLFLYTEKTKKILNKIMDYVPLEADAYEKRRVHETEPLDIYREIKRSYIEWGKPEKMYIDFTGGTKAMSAAAAMAGALIQVQLVYVGTTDYLADFRKPNPGTETLYYITNPLSVFGDLEIEKAFILFEKFNFAGAQEKLALLKENIPDPSVRQQLNFAYLLAKTYEAWDSLDFEAAYKYIYQLNQELLRDRLHRTFLLMDFKEHLKGQEMVLDNLKKIPSLIKEKKNIEILQSKDIILALMFTMYQCARLREKQENFVK